MKRLSRRVDHHRALYHWYHGRLAEVAGIDFRPVADETCLWYPDIFVPDADGLQEFLSSRRIQTRRYFPPIHTQPAYRCDGSFPNATSVSPCGLWLPAAPYLTERHVERICTAIVEWATAGT